MTKGRARILAAVLLLAAIGIAGALVIMKPGQSPQPSMKTFYAVAYSWGFAFYDESFNRIDTIAVNKGDRVLVHFMSMRVLSQEGINAFVDEQVKKGIGLLRPNDPQIRDQILRALEYELFDHTLTVGGYGLTVEVDGSKSPGKARDLREAVTTKDPTIRPLEFVADKVGTFPIYCAVYECGYGHTDMIVPAGLAVS